MKTKYIIQTQAKEWYGDEDHIGDPAYGRHKMKGGQDFIFDADEYAVYGRENELMLKFNKKYDRTDRFYRYEAKNIEWVDEPAVAKMINGEIIIPWTDSMD